VAKSGPAAIKLMRNRLWQEGRVLFEELFDHPLAATPPNRNQLEHGRGRLVQWLGVIQECFRQAAVGQARHLGNFSTGVAPDWADPSERHAIYGDGTVMAPYSDVYTITCPITGDVRPVGSRASSPGRARIQRLLTDTSEDGKQAVGVNFVHLHTWTPVGRVVLGTDVALAAEQWPALDLVDAIAARAGDGVHTLVWDRVFTGWLVDYLMGQHRIQVINKAVGRAQDSAHDHVIRDAELKEHVSRLAAEYGVESTGAMGAHLRQAELANRFYAGAPLPLGVCLYRKKDKDEFDFVRSRSFLAGQAGGDRDGCRHDLAIDDGGLFIVDLDDDGVLVKTHTATCLRAVPHQRPDGTWGRTSDWHIPCEHGGFRHTTVWEPDALRHTPDTPKNQRGTRDLAGSELRPLSRIDDVRDGNPFGAIAYRREDAESYNKWLKSTFVHHGRASHLELEQQHLDVIAAALLNNAITWSKHLDGS
jgi:hypothetical protein